MASVVDPEIVDDEISERSGVPDSTALTALARGEIDIQISTAKKYPRSITKFKRSAEQLACLDEETAASMFYRLPRGGKQLEGPSVRLAEVVGSTWGNLRYGARIVEVGDRFITAQGACHDLESNNAITVDIRRRITDKHGKRFNDDMIQVTGNAACAIALRQAIFKIVPFALVKDIYEKAKLTSIGKAESMSANRVKAMQWYVKAGATEAQVLAFLGRASIEDITVDDLITLRGMVTAIKDGDTTIEQSLEVEKHEPQKKSRTVAPKEEPKAEQKTKSAVETTISQLDADFAACKTGADCLACEADWKTQPEIVDGGMVGEVEIRSTRRQREILKTK